MRGDDRDARLHEGRSAERGDDDVRRGRGHAHAEDDAGDHQHGHEQQKVAARERGDDVDELVADAGQADDADDDARAGAAGGNHHGILGRKFQRAAEPLEGEARFGTDHAEDHDAHRAVVGAGDDAAAHEQNSDQKNQREQVV